MRSSLPTLAVCSALAMTSGAALSAVIAGVEVIPFKAGISHVRLDGKPYTLVSAWRDNGNAHGYNVVNVYANGTTKETESRLAAVPVFIPDPKSGKPGREELGLTTSGGADCTLHTFRLFHAKGTKGTQLVIADRDFGHSFADTAPVHFSFYRLASHEDDGIGPPQSFDFDHASDAAASYCDVDEALEKELGLPAVEGASLPWAGGP
ncbi:hypothetical protein KPL74_04940 [Bacillus sp. NP157]|nr:hypothetical protein KPL74_04940 [Bacillus sp. NP157]